MTTVASPKQFSPSYSELVASPLGRARYSTAHWRAKRWLDIAAAVVVLTLLSPLLAAIAVAIRASSQGSAIFRQTRIGFDGEEFEILKFRTMHLGNDDAEHRHYVSSMLNDEMKSQGDRSTTFKIAGDVRVTAVGRWLRRLSLDELPQLLNVLRGQMSLVGPRPALGYEVDLYDERQLLRSKSLPGITSLAQVEGRNELHMVEAIEADLHYVRQCTLWFDLQILFRTVGVVARGSGS